MIKLRTAVRIQEVGDFPEGHGAVLMCDGKKVTIIGLTEHEARQLAKHLYEELVITIATDAVGPDVG